MLEAIRVKGNSVMAEIVREGSKEDEGLRPGLEDYRWLQGTACDIFPMALVPSWE